MLCQTRKHSRHGEGTKMDLILIIIVLIVLFGGGYYGYSRQYYGPSGFGILGVVLVVLLLLILFGGLGGRRYF